MFSPGTAWNGSCRPAMPIRRLRRRWRAPASPSSRKWLPGSGDERLNASLAAFGYGNHDASGNYPYWLEGNLRITALDQIAFIDKLRRGDLPVSPEAMATVRDILIVEKGDGYVTHAKTGWATSPEPDLGWIVGWVDHGKQASLFALNLDITAREHPAARLAIVKAVLKEVGALP